MSLITIVKKYWKSIAVIIAIMYLSFASPSTFKKIPTFSYVDKLVHVLMYAGLSFMLIIDYKQTDISNKKKLQFVLICIVFPIVFGGLIEVFQGLLFAPRSPSWLDWAADILGVWLGWLAIKVLHPILQKIE